MNTKHFYIAVFDRVLLTTLIVWALLCPESLNQWLKIVFDF